MSRKSSSHIWEEIGRCKDTEKEDQEIRTWSIQYSNPVTDDVWGYLQGSTTLDHCSLNYDNKSYLSFCQCHINQTLFWHQVILTKLGGFLSFRQTLRWMEPISCCHDIIACSRLAEAESAQYFLPVPPAVPRALCASHIDCRHSSYHVRYEMSKTIIKGSEIQYFFPDSYWLSTKTQLYS